MYFGLCGMYIARNKYKLQGHFYWVVTKKHCKGEWYENEESKRFYTG